MIEDISCLLILTPSITILFSFVTDVRISNVSKTVGGYKEPTKNTHDFIFSSTAFIQNFENRFHNSYLSKMRLTGLAISNAIGEKLPTFVIGKSANPGALRTSNQYHASTNVKQKAG